MKQKPVICAIVAVGPENVIGRDKVMPWHCPVDLKHFRKTTMGYPCLFGRKTFEGMGKQPLDGRINLICSSKKQEPVNNTNLQYVDSIESAIAQSKHWDKIFICGGAQIYKYALDMDLIDVFYLTKIKNTELQQQVLQNPKKYTYFPVNVDTFFTPEKWTKQEIIYQDLKQNKKSACDATFLMFTRRTI